MQKDLRVDGDPAHAATQRRLAELAAQDPHLLFNCATLAASCQVSGQTALPLVVSAAQRLAAYVPHEAIAQWTGCHTPPTHNAP